MLAPDAEQVSVDRERAVSVPPEGAVLVSTPS